MDMFLFVRSAVIGLSIAAPVGPIGLLCIRRTLAEGMISGLACGMGAAAADAVYGWVAAQGLVSIGQTMEHRMWLRAVGSCFLLYLAYRIARSKPSEASNDIVSAKSTVESFVSTFFLTVTNPMTIFSFLAIFGALGIVGGNFTTDSTALIITAVSGVFAGSLLWWLLLTAVVSKLRRFVGGSSMAKINLASAAIIGAFAIAMLFEAAKK